MSAPRELTPLWVRAVVDPDFRAALIADPLRAVAEAGDVEVSGEQVRQLEEMELDQRAEFVRGVVREVHRLGGQARFGAIRDDGRIGGTG
ncbi:MAG: Ribosomally synthesized peptide [Miltoncostaeaceae bacterium]|nr:Ribosomally synthesized peptide [Miltoncostaeaceae bacterium]